MNELALTNNYRLLDIQSGAIFDADYAPPIDWNKDLSGPDFEVNEAKDYSYRPEYDEERQTFWEFCGETFDTEKVKELISKEKVIK